MIIVRIIGGLGNQMFQYAFYKFLCKKCSNVKVDVNDFVKYKIHNGFELERIFNIRIQRASNEECLRVGKPCSILNKILIKFNKKKVYDFTNPVDMAITYVGDSLDLKGDIYLFGYWQSFKYFDEIKAGIYQDFTLKESLDDTNKKIIDVMEQCNSISIHIRRGDYLNNKILGNICNKHYYDNAINYIKSKVINPVFFIFSNDIDWCKANINTGCETIYIENNIGKDSYKDLILMSKCKHNIIANSSFSWWGAYLNENKDKIVIYPSKWFNVEDCNMDDICPPDWICININNNKDEGLVKMQ